jgi:hypothetical protein
MGVLSLLARIGGDSSGFESALGRSQKAADRFSNNLTQRVGGAFLAAFSVQRVIGFTRETIRAADEILKGAKAAGVTTEQYQLMRDGVVTFNDEALKSVKLLDEAGDAATRAGQQLTVALAKPMSFFADTLAKSITGISMLVQGFKGADAALDKKFGPGFRGSGKLFTADFWRTFSRGFLGAANEVRDSVAVGASPNGTGLPKEKTKTELREQARILEEIEKRRRDLRMDGLDATGKIAALEKEIADIKGPGLEKMTPAQELAILEKEIELQRLRASNKDKGLGAISDARRSIGAFGSDSLRQVGNFFGERNSPSTLHLSNMEREIKQLRQDINRHAANNGTAFPL